MGKDLYKDGNLVDAIKKSDKDSLRLLFEKYYTSIYIFIWNKTKDDDLSQDIVQEVFIKIWDSRSNLDESKSIKAYLYRIASNMCIDHLRKQVTRQAYVNDRIDSRDEDSSYKEFESTDNVKRILDVLPDDVRETFVLSRFDKFKYSEISEILDVSVRTVESRISKAIKILKSVLKKKIK